MGEDLSPAGAAGRERYVFRGSRLFEGRGGWRRVGGGDLIGSRDPHRRTRRRDRCQKHSTK